MRFIRNRAGFFAAVTLTFQVGTVAAASVAISCDQGPALEHAGLRETASAGHAGMPGHEGLADCPMLKQEPACPLHAEKHGTHDCDCPTLGCSQTDAGFMALFGAVGILTTASLMILEFAAEEAAPMMSASTNRLASVPLAPPPRG